MANPARGIKSGAGRVTGNGRTPEVSAECQRRVTSYALQAERCGHILRFLPMRDFDRHPLTPGEMVA